MRFLGAYSRLIDFSPRLRKVCKHFFYQYVAHITRTAELKFMNYGFAFIDDGKEAPKLDALDEPNRCSIQLYHHLTYPLNFDGLRVLDIGCGRGGGPDYLRRYLKVRDIIGLDASPKAVSLCRKTYASQGLVFVAGDAEDLPFPDGSFDVVMNIESSHCYNNMNRFLSGVLRVLRQGGYFLFADFRDLPHVELLENQIKHSGMAILRKSDITGNVLAALDKEHDRKAVLIENSAPKFLIKLFKEFGGCRGTRIYNRFSARQSLYLSYILQKPEKRIPF
ncbi:MAG: class I SAM-dependent methyltransferase [Candidatus Aminicenantes bacterium]|nr:class I SAM-dependent methyltransferase [Candidatus Aminicenantes bacterium]